MLVEQYSSDTHVVKPWQLFVKIALLQNTENDSGFPSEPIGSTPTVPLPLSLQALSPVLWETRLRSRCVARSFGLSTRFERSIFQVLSQRLNTHMSCMQDLAINKEDHDTTVCFGSVPKEPLFSLGADWLTYSDPDPPELIITCSTFPTPGLPTDASP